MRAASWPGAGFAADIIHPSKSAASHPRTPVPLRPQLLVSANRRSSERSIRSPWKYLPALFRLPSVIARPLATFRASSRMIWGSMPQIREAFSGV